MIRSRLADLNELGLSEHFLIRLYTNRQKE